MRNKTDLELVALLSTGKTDALQELFVRYQQKAFNIAYHTLGSAEAAEDVVMETFIKLSETKHKITTDFSSYFYRMIVNRCYNYARRENKVLHLLSEEQVCTADNSDPYVIAVEAEAEAEARKALDSLPINQRTAFTLVRLEGMSYRESARVMNISEKALESLMSRARENLKKYYQSKEK